MLQRPCKRGRVRVVAPAVHLPLLLVHILLEMEVVKLVISIPLYLAQLLSFLWPLISIKTIAVDMSFWLRGKRKLVGVGWVIMEVVMLATSKHSGLTMFLHRTPITILPIITILFFAPTPVPTHTHKDVSLGQVWHAYAYGFEWVFVKILCWFEIW